MKLTERYKLCVEDFAFFRFQHKIGGSIVAFLINMGIWNLLAHLTKESYFSSFTVQLIMSLLFTAVFFIGSNPKEK
ncbi:hypothetical protein J8M21_25730 [Pseudoalteromonas luteoviolacea]|uniref:hypothetical protein n=1 Tax=Pseudoalteromonas luteoviolacea TaxID=43657 RepID=UPI001B3A43AC|nr:hypothetical protein [Pseudoalteromonas luteoviolacea]MBQ4880604.1 hypothetical protein [Pseudoalteromonas luteoviolacea]MBQ4909645.1 hypothetical protein [Pseudoalteromonas luteoviolacea]